MERKEMNQLSMMKSVEQFLTDNQLLIADKPALVAAHVNLKNLIDKIETLSRQQSVSTKADTAIKGEAKKNMIDTVLKVAAGMAAHAASTGDTRLKMTAAISHSKLDDMRETDFVNQVRTIYDAALPVAAGLAEWGVTQSDIDALDTSSGEYMSKSPTIRNVKVKAKQATSDLKANFDEANALIKTKLDAMMLPFKTLNPSFHGEYLNARVIIDLRGGHATTPIDTKPVE